MVRLARENRRWGYLRIVGECRTLRVRVSATSVRRILRWRGLGPAPRLSPGGGADTDRELAELLLGLVRRLTDPDGVYGMPAEATDDMVVTGGPAAVAERIAAFGDLGAERVVLSLAGGDWMRQAELAAEAVALLS